MKGARMVKCIACNKGGAPTSGAPPLYTTELTKHCCAMFELLIMTSIMCMHAWLVEIDNNIQDST